MAACVVTLRWQPQENTVTAELVPLVQHQGDFMPTCGNALELVDDYCASLRLLIKDIDGAHERVHLLYYLMFDDAVGDAVVAALRGVSCRLLLDAVGAKRGLRAYQQRLLVHGVEVHAMLPGGLRWSCSGRMDLRNHRKIVVIDNRVAYVGSQNLACPDFVPRFPNPELVARVRGPAVNDLQAVFLSDWFIETGQRFEMQPDAPVCAENVPAQLVVSEPAYPYENARDAGFIRHADA